MADSEMIDRMRCDRPPRQALVRFAVGLTFLVSATVAMAQGRPSSWPERVEVTAESGVPEIHFRMVNNQVLLPVSVNGSEPLDLLLDTGMPGPGIVLYKSPEIKGLSLIFDPGVRSRVRGGGGEGKYVQAQTATARSLTFPGLKIKGSRVLVLPVPDHFSIYHDGIIGSSLFQRFAVELDYDQGVARLHDPEAYSPPGAAQVLPITLRQNLPLVTVPVSISKGRSFEARLVIDLGATGALSLNTEESKLIVVPAPSLSTILGRGLSGLIEGKVARIAELRLGNTVVKQVLTSFPIAKHQNTRDIDSLAGYLGNNLLRRFKTTFDYVGGRLILEPSRSLKEPFVFDHSGIRLRFGEQVRVEGIVAGSPADTAGVEVGDVLTRISGAAITGPEIDRVRAALRVVGEVSLTLRRGDQTLEKVLRLRRLI